MCRVCLCVCVVGVGGHGIIGNMMRFVFILVFFFILHFVYVLAVCLRFTAVPFSANFISIVVFVGPPEYNFEAYAKVGEAISHRRKVADMISVAHQVEHALDRSHVRHIWII